MVCTRSQARVPLSEMTVEHAHKRCRTLSTTKTRAEYFDAEDLSEDGFDEARENCPPSEHIRQMCTPTTLTHRTDIHHTEWLSSPFWRQSLSNDRVNRWENSADEIVLKIFSYLKFEDLFRCALVCRHWRALCYDRLLWSQFNLSHRSVPVDKLLTLLALGTRFLSLSCGEVKPRSASPPKRKEELYLEYADFGRCNISPSQLTRVIECAPNLLKLSLESVPVSGPVLRATAHCTQLQVLNLAMCQNVNPSQLVAITRNCTRLQELNLAWCNISEKTFNRLFPVKCETMKKLNISGGRSTVSCETLRILSSSLPNLRVIDISDCIRINRYGIAHLAVNCPLLEELSCSRVYELSSLDVLSWVKKMKHLRYFNSFPSIMNARFIDFLKKMEEKFPQVHLNKKETSDVARPCTMLHLPKGMARLWEMQLRS